MYGVSLLAVINTRSVKTQFTCQGHNTDEVTGQHFYEQVKKSEKFKSNFKICVSFIKGNMGKYCVLHRVILLTFYGCAAVQCSAIHHAN